MPRRHHLRPDDPGTALVRLEELLVAGSGDDAFEAAFQLLLARAAATSDLPFSPGPTPADTARTLDALVRSAEDRWPGILGPRVNLEPEHLDVCVRVLASVPMDGVRFEDLDALVEHLVARQSRGSKGQFFTPRHVVEACVRMALPGAGETVLDPACGSGAFLVHAARGHLVGVDHDPRAVRVARALLLLAGVPGRIHRANSLVDPIPCVPDLILTNPPFAGEVQEPSVLSRFTLHRPGRRTERDVLFLERCVTLLPPGGRLVIVLPENKLGAKAFDGVREWLLRQVRVVAVLALGHHTFAPHTSQKTCVLLAVRRPQPLPWLPPDEPILFLVSEREGKDAGGRILPRADASPGAPHWQRVDHDLEDAVDRFHAFVQEQGIPWGARP